MSRYNAFGSRSSQKLKFYFWRNRSKYNCLKGWIKRVGLKLLFEQSIKCRIDHKHIVNECVKPLRHINLENK